MSDPIVSFEKTPEEYKNLATFLAQLTREGVTYNVVDNQYHVQVIMTGGF
jgi:hypothetical protein